MGLEIPKWWDKEVREKKKQNFKPLSKFRTQGLYPSSENKGFILVGDHTGLKARKLKRKVPNFGSNIKREELLCFFNQPISGMDNTDNYLSKTVHKQQK